MKPQRSRSLYGSPSAPERSATLSRRTRTPSQQSSGVYAARRAAGAWVGYWRQALADPGILDKHLTETPAGNSAVIDRLLALPAQDFYLERVNGVRASPSRRRRFRFCEAKAEAETRADGLARNPISGALLQGAVQLGVEGVDLARRDTRRGCNLPDQVRML